MNDEETPDRLLYVRIPPSLCRKLDRHVKKEKVRLEADGANVSRSSVVRAWIMEKLGNGNADGGT